MKKLIFIFAAIAVYCTSCTQDLVILHLNDTHSHVDPERSGEEKGLGGSIEQAAYIDEVRAEEGKRNVLLLHGGDFSQGTSYFTELKGNIEIDLMNAMEYDAVVIGNHEFDNGIEELARRVNNLKPAVVCANYDFTGTALDGLVDPYTIVRKAGKKIGIIGLLTDVSDVVVASIAAQLQYIDPIPVTNQYAEYLKNEKGCDFVIALSHLGYREDCELAAAIRNVDVIVGGHSHTHLEDLVTVKDLDGKDVVIVQDWHWGLTIGRLDVDF